MIISTIYNVVILAALGNVTFSFPSLLQAKAFLNHLTAKDVNSKIRIDKVEFTLNTTNHSISTTTTEIKSW